MPGGGRGRLALYGLLGQQLLLLVGQHHRQHQGGGRQVAQAQQQVDHGLLGGTCYRTVSAKDDRSIVFPKRDIRPFACFGFLDIGALSLRAIMARILRPGRSITQLAASRPLFDITHSG